MKRTATATLQANGEIRFAEGEAEVPAGLALREAQRLDVQQRLDGSRDMAARNRLGQYATPPALAREIARYAEHLWQRRTDPVAFLEPALGTGAFYAALRAALPQDRLERASGIEVDAAFADAARELWADCGLDVRQADFTTLAPPPAWDRFNLLIANPPYVRHHHLDREQKTRMQQTVLARTGIRLSGLAGLYCHFLLLADAWLEEGALGLWLIPSEFMDVGYGQAIKRYLTEQVTILHVHRFCPTDAQFADALVSSAVVVYRKALPAPNHAVRFTFGGSLLAPQRSEVVPLSRLGTDRNWTRYAAVPAALNATRTSGTDVPTVTLSDLFAIKRGIATGANDFFILPREEARRLGLPEECLRPILPSPRLLKDAVLRADPDGYPCLATPLALLDCKWSEEEVQRHSPALWQYLQAGRARGVHIGYLTSRRTPWYAQEQRPPSPFLCSYMGRTSEGRKPFRLFWNQSQATVPNVYLMLYPKGALLAALQADPALYAAVWEVLQKLDTATFSSEGRVYGGGLHKMEPKELGRIDASIFCQVVQGLNGSAQPTLFDNISLDSGHFGK